MIRNGYFRCACCDKQKPEKEIGMMPWDNKKSTPLVATCKKCRMSMRKEKEVFSINPSVLQMRVINLYKKSCVG